MCLGTTAFVVEHVLVHTDACIFCHAARYSAFKFVTRGVPRPPVVGISIVEPYTCTLAGGGQKMSRELNVGRTSDCTKGDRRFFSNTKRRKFMLEI